MISEGSCDIEDWRNGHQKIHCCHHSNKLHFKIY